MKEIINWISEGIDELPSEWKFFNKSVVTNSFEMKMQLEQDQFMAYFSDKRIPQGRIPMQYYVLESGSLARTNISTSSNDSVYISPQKVICEFNNKATVLRVTADEYKYIEPERLVATAFIDTFFSTAVSEYTKVGGNKRIGYNYYKLRNQVIAQKNNFIKRIQEQVYLNTLFIENSGYRGQ